MPFIEKEKLKIHYEMAGAGDNTVVLLHGYFASWRWWQPLLKQLPPDYVAYAPDFRGCGDTDRPDDGYTIHQLAADLHNFATALDLPPFHLVGHSLGGVVAMQFALNYPEHVQTLTLVAPGPAEGMSVFYEEKSALYLFELRRDKSFDLLDSTYRFMQTTSVNRLVLRRALRRMMPSVPDDESFTALVDDAARMAPEAVVGFMQAVDEWKIQDDLHEIDIPTIILWGDKDMLITDVEPLKRTAKGLRGRLVIWRGVGHAPQLEQPQRFRRFLTRFIKRNLTQNRSDKPDEAVSGPRFLNKLLGLLPNQRSGCAKN